MFKKKHLFKTMINYCAFVCHWRQNKAYFCSGSSFNVLDFVVLDVHLHAQLVLAKPVLVLKVRATITDDFHENNTNTDQLLQLLGKDASLMSK